MTSAIDTNVVIALWDANPSLSLAAEAALEAAFHRGPLVAAAPVFAELLAAPGRTETIDWDLGEPVWRSAGRAFQTHADRRRRHRSSEPRRILADFLIGAHAETRGHRLLTLDERLYRAAFPKLAIISI